MKVLRRLLKRKPVAADRGGPGSGEAAIDAKALVRFGADDKIDATNPLRG